MNRKIQIFVLLSLLPAVLCASSKLELKLGVSAVEHRIDGKLDSEELKNGFRIQGATSEVTKAWSKRPVTFFLARTGDKLVIFAQSPLPPGSNQLQATDENIFTVTSSEGKKVQIRCNPAGFSVLPAGVESKSLFFGGMWSVEVAIPASAFGMEKFSDGSSWNIQLERNYRNKNEKTFLAENGAAVQFSDAPVVDFYLGKGIETDGSLPTLFWHVANTSGVKRDLNFTMESSWDGAPRALNLCKMLASGEKHVFSFTMDDSWQGERRSVDAVIRDKEQVYFRYRGFFGGKGIYYLNSSRHFDIGVYPSLGKVKARIFSDDTRVMNKISSVDFIIADKENKELSKVNVTLSRSGFYRVWDLPSKLADGFYKLNAVLNMKDGKTEELTREFEYRNYSWLGNQIGLDRNVIIPPFKPLVYDPVKKSVHAVLTGYRFGEDIFSAVYAEGENILASPVKIFVNSRKLVFGNISMIEVAKDRIQAHAVAVNDPAWSIDYDFDYDGLVWIKLRYSGKEPLKLENMFFEVPLNEKYAKLYQSTCGYIRRNPSGYIPDGRGKVWDSLRNSPANAMAYIWMGETRKGLAWFRESLSNWQVAPGTAHHEMIRKNDSVILKNTIVNTPLELSPGTVYEMGFQASPVKPAMKNHRKYQLVNDVAGWTAPKTTPLGLLSSCMMWSGSGKNSAVSVYSAWEPWNGDYSFIRYLKTLYDSEESRDDIGMTVKNFVEKNVPESAAKIMTTHMRHGALVQSVNARLILPYFNPRSASFDQPEFRVFEDEWNNRTFRTGKDGWYSFNPFPSYRDFMAVKIREMARNGMDGVYFDNCYEAGHTDPVMGDCQEIIPGRFQHQFTFMDLRRLVKRTATILYQEGKLIEDRPYVMVHTTNSSMLPVLAFASNYLEWEMFFGARTYQERFSDGYIRAGSLGTQSGCMPGILISTRGGERKKILESALGVMFGYDYSNFLLLGAPEKWFQDVCARMRYLGYGDDKAQVFSGSFPEDNPVKIRKGKVMITTVKYNGSVTLLVGDFGNGGEVEVDLSALQMPQIAALDAVSGKLLGSGQNLKFTIKKHSFKIILLGKDAATVQSRFKQLQNECMLPVGKPPIRNVKIVESMLRGKRTFTYAAENALTRKTKQMVTEVDGKKVFILKKNQGLTFPLPVDLLSLAGKMLEISYRYRIKGMPVNIPLAQGFKVMLVHSANGKNFYGHTAQVVTDNSEWKRAVFGAKLSKDVDGGTLRVNAPAEEILLESIVIRVID
ncbi:MAG: hypothetical protein J6W00_01990 [Lentisphaeria bacterium]|nr:hypothetical protein [Lentisphaeria bacterium]